MQMHLVFNVLLKYTSFIYVTDRIIIVEKYSSLPHVKSRNKDNILLILNGHTLNNTHTQLIYIYISSECVCCNVIVNIYIYTH